MPWDNDFQVRIVNEAGANTNEYINIPTEGNVVHYVPASVFDSVIAGTLRITEISDWELICRSIIQDWLDDVRHEN